MYRSHVLYATKIRYKESLSILVGQHVPFNWTNIEIFFKINRNKPLTYHMLVYQVARMMINFVSIPEVFIKNVWIGVAIVG